MLRTQPFARALLRRSRYTSAERDTAVVPSAAGEVPVPPSVAETLKWDFNKTWDGVVTSRKQGLKPKGAEAGGDAPRSAPRTGSTTKATKEPNDDDGDKESGDSGGGNGGGNDEFWALRPRAILLMSSTSVLVWWLVWSNRTTRPDKEISWQEFRDRILPEGDVEKVKVITGNKRAAVKVYMKETGYTYWFTVSSLKSFEHSLAEAEDALGVKPSEALSVQYDDRMELMDIAPMLGWLLWVGVLLHSTRMVTRTDLPSMMNTQKDKFKPVIGGSTKFKDVAGMNEAKKEIQEFVDFMRHPERFTKLGAKVPSGAILFGPPGTGKTLLAKAVAGESGVPFYSVCGADFVEMYVGVGAARVRELFKSAKKHPRAIIYIDEVDAVGRKRGGSMFGGGSSERENTLNQLLIEMDGFQKAEGKIIVLASTNVSPTSLDDALLRPGRFDRQVFIDKPDIKEREEIFETHLNTINLVPSLSYSNSELDPSNSLQADNEKRKLLGLPEKENEDDVKEEEIIKVIPGRRHKLKKKDTTDKEAFNKALQPNSLTVKKHISRRMSQMSPGFVGADIANICNEGALIAARERKSFVDLECMEKAVDRVIGGIEKRSRVMSDFEKKAVAYHEAGHAVVGWFLEHCDPLMKISIVPRGSAALGYAQYLPSEKQMQTFQQLFDNICMTLGGRASELYHFKHLSTGAQDDLSKVTRMSYLAVSTFGMGRKGGGVVSYPLPGSGDSNIRKPYSEEVAVRLDEEAKELVDKAFKRTMDLIHERREEIDKIANHLLENELITRQDFIDLIGPRPFAEDELPPALAGKIKEAEPACA